MHADLRGPDQWRHDLPLIHVLLRLHHHDLAAPIRQRVLRHDEACLTGSSVVQLRRDISLRSGVVSSLAHNAAFTIVHRYGRLQSVVSDTLRCRALAAHNKFLPRNATTRAEEADFCTRCRLAAKSAAPAFDNV